MTSCPQSLHPRPRGNLGFSLSLLTISSPLGLSIRPLPPEGRFSLDTALKTGGVVVPHLCVASPCSQGHGGDVRLGQSSSRPVTHRPSQLPASLSPHGSLEAEVC